jgi:hypothetical protein
MKQRAFCALKVQKTATYISGKPELYKGIKFEREPE